jgi:hypothetical protein
MIFFFIRTGKFRFLFRKRILKPNLSLSPLPHKIRGKYLNPVITGKEDKAI